MGIDNGQNNLIIGVTKGYKYKMRYVYAQYVPASILPASRKSSLPSDPHAQSVVQD